MLSQAFRVRTIGVGALLRAEQRVGTPRARACAAIMARGELLPDTLALEVLLARLMNSPNPNLNPNPNPSPSPDPSLNPSPNPGQVLLGRLTNSPDIERNGFLIDGFPRSASQVVAVMEDPQWAALRPDCVISLIRPDELIKEFALGRCTDSATGQTYHPCYAPAPVEVRDRLVWLTLILRP